MFMIISMFPKLSPCSPNQLVLEYAIIPAMVKLAMDANNYFDYDDGDDRDINEAEDDDLEQDPNLLKRLYMFGRLTSSSAGGW